MLNRVHSETYDDEIRSSRRTFFKLVLSPYLLQILLSLASRVIAYASGLTFSPELASLLLSVSKDILTLVNEGRTLESLEALCHQIDRVKAETDPERIKEELLELKKEVQKHLDEIFSLIEKNPESEVEKRQIERRLKFLESTPHKAEETSLEISHSSLVESFKELRKRVQNGQFLLELLSDEKTTLIVLEPETSRALLLEEEEPDRKKLKVIESDGSIRSVAKVKAVRVHGPKIIIAGKNRAVTVLNKKRVLELSSREFRSTVLGEDSERKKRLEKTYEENLKYSKSLFWRSGKTGLR